MKKLTVLLLILALALVLHLELSNKDKIWLFFNGNIARSYAMALLEHDFSYQQPDRFIDYTISTKNGYVVFSKHSESVFYGFFPDGIL